MDRLWELLPNRSHDISHIALIPRANDIVLPRAKLRLRECILVLAMKREQLGKTVDKLVLSLALNERNRTSAIHLLTLHLLISERKIPSQCSSFSRCEILHSMETERRKISNLISHLAMTRST